MYTGDGPSPCWEISIKAPQNFKYPLGGHFAFQNYVPTPCTPMSQISQNIILLSFTLYADIWGVVNVEDTLNMEDLHFQWMTFKNNSQGTEKFFIEMSLPSTKNRYSNPQTVPSTSLALIICRYHVIFALIFSMIARLVCNSSGFAALNSASRAAFAVRGRCEDGDAASEL